MEVSIKSVTGKSSLEDLIKPKNEGDAYFDVYAHSVDYDYQKDLLIYELGFKTSFDKKFEGRIVARSSIIKKDLFVTNAVGVIDSSYRGEWKVAFRLKDPMEFFVKAQEDVIEYIYNSRNKDYTMLEILKDETHPQRAYVKKLNSYLKENGVYEIGERCAQITFKELQTINFNVADSLSPTARGEGGFGSTGK